MLCIVSSYDETTESVNIQIYCLILFSISLIVNEPLFQDVVIHSLQAAVLHLFDILCPWVAGIMLLATDDILMHPYVFLLPGKA